MTWVSQRKMNKRRRRGKNRQMSIMEKCIYHRESILCPGNLQKLLLLLLFSWINISLIGFQKVQVTERTLPLHQSPIKFPTIRHVLLLVLLLQLYDMDVSCHRPFLPGTYPEPTVIPTAQASSYRLQYFPCCVWCSKCIIIIIIIIAIIFLN